MSETADRRRRTDLDLFVLALVGSGISTPYQLQKAASLSQGATIPALQRLLEAGFVRQGRPGLRGRTDYKVTPAGKRALKSGWRTLVEEGPSGDLDSDLRVALLALSVGADRRVAAEFLKQSSVTKMESLATVDQREYSTDVAPLARWYSELRLLATKTLLEAESAAARNMAESLPRILSEHSGQGSRGTRKAAGA
jgi:DNA-binding PadR family transcriptional regulator